jgi:hypothetical protein
LQQRLKRRLLVAMVLCAAALAPSGCKSISRGVGRVAQDVVVVLVSPLQLTFGTLGDTFVDVADDPGWGVPALPLIIVPHLLKHVYATAVHVIDLPLAPIHIIMNSRRMKVYRTSQFPFEVRSRGLQRGTRRATHSARGLVRRTVLLGWDVAEAGIGAATKAGSWWAGIPMVSLKTALRLVTAPVAIGLCALDYAVSPIYLPFGPKPLVLDL